MENENVTKDARAPAADDGDNVKKKLASNIMFLRYELNLSRAALADKVGTSEANIGQYERGGRTHNCLSLCTSILLSVSSRTCLTSLLIFCLDVARKIMTP